MRLAWVRTVARGSAHSCTLRVVVMGNAAALTGGNCRSELTRGGLEGGSGVSAWYQ
jgi:hypothetical protein